ncbi:hypothetical protein TW81_06575 [Vibrio galatheae]|uniref:NADP-dependent oxidoreductase domain-containing protein n=1 Tax=Vibrio galatheae TaxID=579748 RepID=A0A0F4NM84_9VIBR|nr:aldo/keto reductase [Vibrio galatheae]KJY83984.1 hypothetical protein TW81_06575 [Vibrio galatheae]
MQPKLGNKLIGRIGYGAMRLPGLRGNTADPQRAHDLLLESQKLGINLIASAFFYGDGLANKLIAESLHPYSDQIIISTKVGVKIGQGGRPEVAAKADEIKTSIDDNLKSLKVTSLDLVFLRLPGGPLRDEGIPMEESLQCLAKLKAEGIIKHIGLSCASLEQLKAAQKIVAIDAVQNAMFVGNLSSLDVVKYCDENQIPFFAYFPLGMGKLIDEKVDLTPIAEANGVTKAQIALAWLLSLSAMVIPIPGTSNVSHLKENVSALDIQLDKEVVESLMGIL